MSARRRKFVVTVPVSIDQGVKYECYAFDEKDAIADAKANATTDSAVITPLWDQAYAEERRG